jgi:hypothetical protein
MNKFLIFGDSFADEHSPPHPSFVENDEWQEKHSYRWPIKLKEKFENRYAYVNQALQGSSPYNALQRMQDFNISKDDIILFFLSDFDRIDFSVPEEIKSHTSNIFWSSGSNKVEFYDDPSYYNNRKLKAFFMLHEMEINFFYKTLNNILSDDILEKLFTGYLKNFAHEKECRIMLFHKNNFSNLKNTEYFYQFKKSLAIVTDEEWPNFNKKLLNGDFAIVDERVNHLSPDNHEIMLDTICKIINHDYDNILEFKKEIYDKNIDEHIVYRGSSDRKFIYE